MILDPATAYTLTFVRTSLPPAAGRVLEVGCGNGDLAAALASTGLEVVALDVDLDAVAEARQRGVDAHEAEWPDFAGTGFDAVLFTRSLHHVPDLEASVARAFEVLAPDGRVIVEDFMAEGAPPATAAWFRSLAGLFRRGGLLPQPTPTLLEMLGTTEEHGDDAAHDHELHASAAIEEALRKAAGSVAASGAAYYFRYLLPALGDRSDLGVAILDHELSLIETGAIAPLGRRYVAAPAPL